MKLQEEITLQDQPQLFEDTRSATDLSLFVRTSEEKLTHWNRKLIIEALLRETDVSFEQAEQIAAEVEAIIKSAKLESTSAPLVRELVNAKLVEKGLAQARKQHTRLGMPLYDVRRLIAEANKENANIPHNPEATNLALAEHIKKEFALLEVFSEDIADAHMNGDLHLHDLGFIDRPYCSGQSLEYVKKFGLDLPNALSIARPAKHPEVLLGHMVKFSAALQGHFAGAIGWDAVNLFFAPYLEGMPDEELGQLAQMLIYEYSQQAVARGGQAIFSDINLYWEVPKHFRDVPALGPGGQYTGKTYKEYEKTAQRFLWKLFEVYMEGDAAGRPFFFPKPLVHMTEDFFHTDGHEDFLAFISEVAAEKGNTYFVFDRGETAKISECCRLSFKLEQSDLDDAKQPWRMRYSALQNVTLNLPRLGLLSNRDEEQLFQRLDRLMELAAKAHLQKKRFIEKLLARGESGPLALLAMKRDGESYLRMHRVSYLIGMLGLNEMVQAHTGQQLHESRRALMEGLKVIAHMQRKCRELSARYGMHFVLEQTPAESTAYRFAKLDHQAFGAKVEPYLRGELKSNEIYYTNSTYLNNGLFINPVERVTIEGKFHPMIEAGALTHVWLGEARPGKDSIANFVLKTFQRTENAQIAFSPEFTFCAHCNRTTRGLHELCPQCGSEQTEGITRVTGYFSKITSWNDGKLGELKERYKNHNYFGSEAQALSIKG